MALKEFVEYLNDNKYNLQFICNYHAASIDFLDVTLWGCLLTGSVICKTYQKPYSKNAKLLVTSCHPTHNFKAIPVGEFTTARKNCSTEELFYKKCNVIKKRLLKRGFPVWSIEHGRRIAGARN